jgi:CRP-like cAMP-binding protein
METLARVRRVAAGERIVEPEQPADSLFILRSGVVEVHGLAPGPSRLGPGDIFGEAALILSEPYRLRAVALAETELVVVGLVGLQKLCLESPDFAFRLIRQLARRSGHMVTAQDLERRRGATRLARAILDLAGKAEPPVKIEGRLMDLAQASETPIREAYRCVQRWLEQRILRLSEDQLSLVDPDALRAVTSERA